MGGWALEQKQVVQVLLVLSEPQVMISKCCFLLPSRTLREIKMGGGSSSGNEGMRGMVLGLFQCSLAGFPVYMSSGFSAVFVCLGKKSKVSRRGRLLLQSASKLHQVERCLHFLNLNKSLPFPYTFLYFLSGNKKPKAKPFSKPQGPSSDSSFPPPLSIIPFPLTPPLLLPSPSFLY